MNKQIATELLVLRKRADKTINEVASDINIDPGTLSRYENSKNNISIEILEKLLDYYGEDISIFFENVSANMHK